MEHLLVAIERSIQVVTNVTELMDVVQTARIVRMEYLGVIRIFRPDQVGALFGPRHDQTC